MSGRGPGTSGTWSATEMLVVWTLIAIAIATVVGLAVKTAPASVGGKPSLKPVTLHQEEALRGWNSQVFTLNVEGLPDTLHVFCAERVRSGSSGISCFQVRP